jgi:hypothetical protein
VEPTGLHHDPDCLQAWPTGLGSVRLEFESGTLHLRRAKGGATSTYPLLGDELRALRTLKREAKSPFVFVSEHGATFWGALRGHTAFYGALEQS